MCLWSHASEQGGWCSVYSSLLGLILKLTWYKLCNSSFIPTLFNSEENKHSTSKSSQPHVDLGCLKQTNVPEQ